MENLSKDCLRKEFQSLLRKLDKQSYKLKSSQVCDQLYNFFSLSKVNKICSGSTFHSFKNFGLFSPLKTEPDITDFCNQITLLKKNCSFPLIKNNGTISENTMEFRLSLIENLKSKQLFNKLKSSITLNMPKLSDQIVVPDVLIIPGLAFDQSGNRLGKGGGFFDKYLDCPRSLSGKVKFSGLKIGVCFSEQIVKNVPVNSYDQKMDYVITDKNIFQIKE